MVVLKKTDCFEKMKKLGSLSSDSSGQLDVLGHDGDTLGVDGAQVGVLEQTDEVSLAGLPESRHHCRDSLNSPGGCECRKVLRDNIQGITCHQKVSTSWKETTKIFPSSNHYFNK